MIQKVKDFVTPDLIKDEIEQEYLDKLVGIKKNDHYYAIKKSALENECLSNLDSLKTFESTRKRLKKRKILIDHFDKKEVAQKNSKIKSIIDFDVEQANSIKSLDVEVKLKIHVTT